MKVRCNKKGYFFLLDSMIALGVLSVGAFLVLSTYSNVPFQENVAVLSEDIMQFFSNNKIKDINNEYARVGGTLWQQGLITNQENSLLQQVGEFYFNNDIDTAEKFIVNLTQNTLPQQFLFEIEMDNTLIFPQNPSSAHIQSKEKTAVIIPSRKIVQGILDKGTGEMFGPYEAVVMVWYR